MKREEIVKTIKALKGEAGHKKVLEVYNSQKPLPQGYKVKQSDAWCATTVSAVFLMNNYNKFSECSCPRMIEKAKKIGLWKESDGYKPEKGDVIMYDWQDDGKGDNKGVADHVGIVIAVDGDSFTVREGNKGGSIGNRPMKVNGKYIRGYILPKYEKTEEKVDDSTYIVKAGDTLTKIAKDHGLTLSQLLKLNKQITDPNKIYVGDKIKIRG